MFPNLVALLVLGLVCNLGDAVDSDGTDFVFSYAQYSETPFAKTATASVIVIPSINAPTYCNFSYLQTTILKQTTLVTVPVFGKNNEYSFNFNDVVLNPYYEPYEVMQEIVADFRIFAKCTQKVKLIGRISDPLNSYGDFFLIPSLTLAATKYVLAMPSSSAYRLGSLSFLPVSKAGDITITVMAYVDNNPYGQLQTFTYDTAVGKDQSFISFMFDEFVNSSVVITSSTPMMILLSAPSVTTSPQPTSYCGKTCFQDYVAFMPIGSSLKKCGSTTTLPEERFITHHYASRIYVSPPHVDDSCNDNSKITVYDDITDLAGRAVPVSKSGATAISLINKNQTGFLTYEGEMSTYRLGSIVQGDGMTAFGHFASYLPSIQEWITGPTQFYTLAKDCVLELYISAPVINLKFVTIDGIPLANLNHTETYIDLFDRNLMQYVIPIQGYGVHSLANGAGTSVSFVVCKNVNGIHNAAGYLTGFNKF
uniref:CUB_2 domain-containing protein n=1 Tax=Rhabditophanes sp. KR3021 TaxID=114890 RepID=A0AC35U789_9BILA